MWSASHWVGVFSVHKLYHENMTIRRVQRSHVLAVIRSRPLVFSFFGSRRPAEKFRPCSGTFSGPSASGTWGGALCLCSSLNAPIREHAGPLPWGSRGCRQTPPCKRDPFVSGPAAYVRIACLRPSSRVLPPSVRAHGGPSVSGTAFLPSSVRTRSASASRFRSCSACCGVPLALFPPRNGLSVVRHVLAASYRLLSARPFRVQALCYACRGPHAVPPVTISPHGLNGF